MNGQNFLLLRFVLVTRLSVLRRAAIILRRSVFFPCVSLPSLLNATALREIQGLVETSVAQHRGLRRTQTDFIAIVAFTAENPYVALN